MTQLRPDIEGLRALAVALVVAFHFFPGVLPGAFVGVDVFFVISGYLITGSLLHARSDKVGVWDWLVNFWARRARRLLPNALLVLVVVGFAGMALMAQFSLKRLGSDIAWSAVYATNWLFVLRSVDYLSWDETQRSALLHFWSLAVEEQFYLFWPLVLLALSLLPRLSLRWGVATLAVASLGYCVWMSDHNMTTAFFSTPARAWELLVGAWLACGATLPVQGHRSLRRAGLTLAGVAMIMAASLWLSDETQHPGLATLLPVLGAALALAAGPSALPGAALLAYPVLLWVGGRSYSIYLWHWPVLQLGGQWAGELGVVGKLFLLGLAVLLAEAAHRWVEQPARFIWARNWSSMRVLVYGLVAGFVVAGFGVGLRAMGANDLRELLGRNPVSSDRSKLPLVDEVRADLPRIYQDHCHLAVEVTQSPECVYGATHATPTVVLFGDSHAAQWFTPLDAVAASQGHALRSWTKSSCPSVEIAVWNAGAKSRFSECEAWREATLQRILELRPQWVLLSNLIDVSSIVLDPNTGRPMRGRDAFMAWTEGLTQVIHRLRAAGIGVVVIRDVPRPRPDVLDCLYSVSDTRRCARSLVESQSTPSPDVLAARQAGAVLWDLGEDICPGGLCEVVRGGAQVVYRDSNHITDTEAKRLTPALQARWRQTLGVPVPKTHLR